MSCDILIVGQGLAGTLLAWEFERVGIPFKIVDAGHAHGASRVAAGIINPITGQRIVKSWMIDTMLPVARESYTAFEKVLGLSLWREMRVRRLYVNEAERRVLAEKQARGDLGDYARANDGDGFWIEGAARVDVFPDRCAHTVDGSRSHARRARRSRHCSLSARSRDRLHGRWSGAVQFGALAILERRMPHDRHRWIDP